jgi:hypothetical protein
VLREIETGVSPWRQTTHVDTGDSSVIKRLLLGTAAGVFGAAFAAGACAQAVNDTELEKVVVTAQRRQEGAQDVGIALSVIDGKELAARGVTTVNGLQQHTPSLEAEPAFGGGQPQFRLRGVGFSDYASNNTSTVGIYVDEVALPFRSRPRACCSTWPASRCCAAPRAACTAATAPAAPSTSSAIARRWTRMPA